MTTINDRVHRGYKQSTSSFFPVVSIAGFCLFIFSSCSIPSLEKPQCTEARDSVKQFYSWYLGTDAEEKSRHPEIYARFISPSFPFDPKGSETDPYFLTNDFPKTFRLGSCKVVDPEKVDIQVQLFWRDDIKTVQKEVHAEAVKPSDKWLIDKVSN